MDVDAAIEGGRRLMALFAAGTQCGRQTVVDPRTGANVQASTLAPRGARGARAGGGDGTHERAAGGKATSERDR